MAKYLFLLHFFLYFSFLIISYLPFSYASDRFIYKRRIYPPNGYIICNKEGVQKLIAMRIAQWERTKSIKSKGPIPGEDCARHETKVVFFEVAQEYFFPYEAKVFTEEPNGKYPCPWDSDKRCINFYGPVNQYVKAQYLDLNKEWQEGVFYRGTW